MPHNSPLTFRVANRKDFAIPLICLFVLAMLSAMLSTHIVQLGLLVFLIFGAGLIKYTLDFCKVNVVELVSSIFPDGKLTLESNHHPETAGYLDGQQWCTRHVAVLRYTTGGKRKFLVLLSAQQDADHYRRLNVWLRQDFCTDSGENPVSM